MNITNTIITHPRKFSLIISLFACLLFFSSTPQVNVGYGDSDEFLAVGHSWGLAHPTGYSLYTAVLHIASRVALPGTTEAQRMHGISGIAAAAAIYFSMMLLFEIDLPALFEKKRLNNTIKVIAITTTAITLTTTKLFWLYAQVAEKYIFSTPFLAALLLLGYRLCFKPSPKIKTIAVFGLLYGLLLSHHQSMVFLLPFIMYVSWTARLHSKIKQFVFIIAFTLIGFVLPLSLTAIQQSRHVQPSWYIVPGIQGYVDLLVRSDFRGNVYGSNATVGYLPKQLTLSQITGGTINYFRIFLSSTAWWTVLPLVMVYFILFKKHKSTLIFFSLPAVFLGIAVAIYLSWPADLGAQATTVRFYIPSLIAWGPLLFLGLYELLFRLYRFVILLGITKKRAANILTLVILIPLLPAISSYAQISLKKFDLISKLYTEVLTNVKPNSIVTCYSDSSCFALLYEQTVNHLRPDIDLVPLAYPLVKDTITAKKLAGFTYTNNPYLMMDIVTWNIGQRPVYAVDISQYYYSFFGFDNGFLTYVPSGYASEISHEMPITINGSDYQLTNSYIQKKTPSFDLMRRFLIQSLSQTHFTNAYAWLKIGDRPRAQKELSLAMNLAYQLTQQEKITAGSTRVQVEKTLASPVYAPGSKSATSTMLIPLIHNLLQRNYNSQAFAVAKGAVMANPRDPQARIELARIFQKMGDVIFTKREYLHVLMLDPQNQEAQQAINTLAP